MLPRLQHGELCTLFSFKAIANPHSVNYGLPGARGFTAALSSEMEKRIMRLIMICRWDAKQEVL